MSLHEYQQNTREKLTYNIKCAADELEVLLGEVGDLYTELMLERLSEIQTYIDLTKEYVLRLDGFTDAQEQNPAP